MPDITMCAGWYHPECKDCLRRIAKPDMWQAYIDPPRESPCYLYLEDGSNKPYGKSTVRSRSKQQP